MADIVAFLAACINEDKQAALIASGSTVIGYPGHWNNAPGGDEWEALGNHQDEELLVALRPGLPRPPTFEGGLWGAIVSVEASETSSAMPAFRHMARHDPARVLRDVAAKRAILARHSYGDDGEDPCNTWSRVQDFSDEFDTRNPCPDLRILATAYEGRPGFDERWRM